MVRKDQEYKELLRMRTLVLDGVSEPVDVRQKQLRDRLPIFIWVNYSSTVKINNIK